jgi:epoxyqueuosine reductase
MKSELKVDKVMIEQIIEKRLVPESDYIYGYANLNGLLGDEFIEYQYGISIGKRLDDNIVDLIENGPTLEYFNHYKDVNEELNALATNICNELIKENINCIGIVPTISPLSNEFKPYSEKLRYKVSHKMIATRAGLGWIGKTDLFISKAFGPRLRLVSILIDKPPKTKGRTIDRSKCGTCDICVKKCPAQAANGILWNINTDRDVFFDAHKCKNKCCELGKSLLNKDTTICGICVSVCPFGKMNYTGNNRNSRNITK